MCAMNIVLDMKQNQKLEYDTEQENANNLRRSNNKTAQKKGKHDKHLYDITDRLTSHPSTLPLSMGRNLKQTK